MAGAQTSHPERLSAFLPGISERLLRRYAIVAFAFLAVAFLWRSGTLLFSHYGNSSAEGANLYGVLNVADGQPLYPRTDAVPFHLYTYTPLHPWIVGTAMRLVPAAPTFLRWWGTRLFSGLCFALTLFLLWGIARRNWHVDRLDFAVAAGLAAFKFADYALTARNDLLALLFEISAVTVWLAWTRDRRRVWLAVFVAATVAALLTRQNSVTAIGAAALYCALTRRFVVGAAVGAAYVGAVAAIFAVLQWGTDGAFALHAFQVHATGWRHIYWTDHSLLTFYATYPIFFAFAASGLRRPARTDGAVYLRLVALLGFGLALAQFFRPGGDTNYFFEAYLAAIPFCAAEIARARRDRHAAVAWALVGTQILLIASLLTMKIRSANETYARLPFEEIAEFVRREYPGHGILSGNWAQGLGVNLRGWERFGPELINGGQYAAVVPQKLSWVTDETIREIQDGSIQTIVIAGLGCAHFPTEIGHPDTKLNPYFAPFVRVRNLYPWLCIYRNPAARPPTR